ncbi:HAMP domain-containing histidine kinase [Peptoniphilus sp. KCTC 25270]|uniref:sensor histidine kinase n=1 Tax=Peptoniphilus sp. KCTC 25270 TaxID=2897414 RepID=UPI001E399D5F|nr:HAMP domain-containing sensor histidine kinase [Peptoniphilus sp. KCTC 25270]MCD1147686.1 HAMP domain-containing histidine kinase [Peptoniphilus sp. KCTC 25270]
MKKFLNNVRHSLVAKSLFAAVLIFALMLYISNIAIGIKTNQIFQDFGVEIADSVEDEAGEGIFVLLSEQQIRATSEYKIYTIIVIGCTFFLGTLLMYLVLSRLMKPLKDLSEEIAQLDIENVENLSKRIDSYSADYEIDLLKNSFNDAMKKLYEGYEKERVFSSNVAHELRTPLAIMQSKLDVYKMERELGEEEEIFVEDLSQTVVRLSQLVEGLLLFTRESEVKYEYVDVGSLVEEIFLNLDQKAKEKNISLLYHPPSFPVKGDEILLSRILLNLVENGIKYSNVGGEVAVNMEEEEESWILKVKDRGIGISLEDQKKIFDLFYRTDQSRSRETGGFGIGLSLTENIVKTLGGKIAVVSKEGKGSEFILEFPKVGK